MAQTLPKHNKTNGSEVDVLLCFRLRRTEYYVSGSANEIHGLVSNQEETDTSTVQYLKYAAKLGHKSAVVTTERQAQISSLFCCIMLNLSHLPYSLI